MSVAYQNEQLSLQTIFFQEYNCFIFVLKSIFCTSLHPHHSDRFKFSIDYMNNVLKKCTTKFRKSF